MAVRAPRTTARNGSHTARGVRTPLRFYRLPPARIEVKGRTAAVGAH
jgi:hypothetical protein